MKKIPERPENEMNNCVSLHCPSSDGGMEAEKMKGKIST